MVAIFAAESAVSAGIAGQPQPESILSDTPKTACDPALDQADVTPGVDVDGRPVASADLPAPPIHADGQIAVPLKPVRGRGGNAPYVMVDGKKLDPLLNPRRGCR